ncbi:MAG: hypothetical protein AAGC60_25040 [Acidobacteriota bacterium]
MAWNFKPFRNDDIANVIPQVTSELNDLETSNPEGPLPALAAKVALANRLDGDALGVVFYDNQLTSIPDEPEGRIQFSALTKRVSSSDPTPLYEEIANTLDSLHSYEAFWARVGFTDRKSGDTTLTLYWPSMQS